MKRMYRGFAALLIVFFAGSTAPLQSATTTAEITATTMGGAPACMAWRPSGVCFWLRCTFFGCSVRTSLRVSNYAPDLVVSAFHEAPLHPWSDFGRPVSTGLMGAASGLLGSLVDSAGTRTRDDRRDKNHPFRDANAIGHPAAVSNYFASSFGYVCPPAAVNAFQPYFESYLDAYVWRSYLPAELLFLESYIPGLREVGTFPLNTWGNVYPREGRITQANEVKGAAVLAQRVGDIVTRTGQPHVYTSVGTGGMTTSGNLLIWLPPELRENDATTGKWQMMSPQRDTSCYAFGANDSILPVQYGDGRVDAEGAYAWTLWRPYSCCSIQGIFIGAIVF
jgi:integrating conjugative element protein (TIGR03756 family)